MNKKRILVVDDEIGFTHVLKLNIESAGEYIVTILNDAADVVETAKTWRPDIILLDVVMPGIEGPDVMNALHSDPATRHIPIIFLTATITQEEAREHEGEIGGHSFLSKPCDLDSLLQSIQAHLE